MKISRNRFTTIALICALAATAAAVGYFIWKDARRDTLHIELGDQSIELTRER